jgi:hypothetical protein
MKALTLAQAPLAISDTVTAKGSLRWRSTRTTLFALRSRTVRSAEIAFAILVLSGVGQNVSFSTLCTTCCEFFWDWPQIQRWKIRSR